MVTLKQHLKAARKKRSEYWAAKTKEEKSEIMSKVVKSRKWRPVVEKKEKI